MGFKIDTNDTLTVKSIDEKWADVTCEVCGQTERIKRTDIYKFNRYNVQVTCGYCKYQEQSELEEVEEIN
jgi:predicted nucleic-acid-binding Zn-ribbon protein